MPPPNPTDKLKTAPVADLVLLLLKQFQRLLTEADIPLKTPELTAIAEAIENRDTLPEKSGVIRETLLKLVRASLDDLQTRFGLTFAESLQTDMNSIGGWETTADFLELANHKSNAELRISAGATLLLFLGDSTHAAYLLTVIEHDADTDDVDAVLAKRAFAHATGIDIHSVNDLEMVRGWLTKQD